MTPSTRSKLRLGLLLGLIAILLLLAGLAGWNWLQRSESRAYTLYYTDTQAMYLVPVSNWAELPRDEREALTRILGELSRPPEGLQPTLPKGASAEVQTISHGQANITLRLPATLGSGGERLLAGAVTKTAASLGGVREVRLQLRNAQGNAYESQHLDLSAPLSPNDPGVENLFLDGAQEGLMVTLYYATSDGRYLVPLRRALPARFRAKPLEGSFDLLLAGPPSELSTILAPSVPAAPAIGWGGVRNGVAQITWPSDLEAPSAQALRAIALTLTEFDGVHAVRLQQGDLEIAYSPRPETVNALAAPASPRPAATASVYPAP